jgi:hypothetical protein
MHFITKQYLNWYKQLLRIHLNQNIILEFYKFYILEDKKKIMKKNI